MYLTGQEIKKRRNQLGMSQDELADKSGVSKSYISHYENGRIETASEKQMTKLCIALGYTVADEDSGASIEVKIARLRADMKSGELSTDELLEYAESIKVGENDRDPRISGDLHLIMARLYRKKRKYSDAVRCAGLAEEVFAWNKETLSWCKSVFESALIKYDKSDYAESLEECKIVVKRLREIPNQNTFLVKVCVQIAKCASSIGKHEVSKEYLGMAEAQRGFIPSTDWLSLQAESHRATGMALIGDSAFNDALASFQTAAVLYKEANRNVDLLVTHYNIALVHMKLADYDVALEKAKLTLDDQIRENVPANNIADSVILIARVLLALDRLDDVSYYCDLIINNGDAHIQRRAYAIYYKAEIEYAKGNLTGFNSGVASVISMLRKAGQDEYAVRFMDRYLEVNHVLSE